ncbi:MAG TPA: glycosyltransferase, partial [Petrotogaceae bacterium]|nr:glycosyltransferase [Petrotogaceae bacterium]
MLLSICMMVKNEERHLEECLQSLQPLVRELGSEIIVVDTGSTDSTVEIAKKYTDKLYFHEWNNDFSGMRAVTISYAKGEWIFIIDGDEVLQDAAEIIDFFRSGLYKEYKTAMLEVKNFSKKDLSIYSLLGSPRLFRAGTFHYEGAVHNQIIHEFPGLKLIATMLLHYGYIAEDKELMERKFERTSALLKKELEKNPNSVYYRYQLSATYLMHGDVDKALEEGEKAYFMIKDDNDKVLRYMYILGYIAKIYIKLERFEEMFEASEKGLSFNQEYLDLWFYNFYYFFNKKEHDKIIEKGLKYIDVHENFKYLAMSRNSSVIMDTLDKIDLVRLFVARSFFEKKDYESVLKQIMLINPSFEFKYEDIEIFVKACIKSAMFCRLIEYATRFLTKNAESMNFFILSVEVNKKELLSDEKTELYRAFSESKGEYSNLNKIRYDFYTGAPGI